MLQLSVGSYFVNAITIAGLPSDCSCCSVLVEGVNDATWMKLFFQQSSVNINDVNTSSIKTIANTASFPSLRRLHVLPLSLSICLCC